MIEIYEKKFADISLMSKRIGAHDLVKRIDNIRSNIIESDKIQITVISGFDAYSQSIVFALLGCQDFFTGNIVCLHNNTVRFIYSESTSYRLITSDGAYNLSKEIFLQKWSEYSSNADYRGELIGELRLPHELLNMVNFSVFTYYDNPSNKYWEDIMDKSHYLIIRYRALVLLSAEERRIFNDIILPGFDKSRLAVVVDQMDKLNKEEREEVNSYIKKYLLKNGGEEIPYFFISSTLANKVESSPDVSLQTREFYNFVTHSVINDAIRLHQKAIATIINQCIEDLDNVSKLIRKSLSVDIETNEQAINLVKSSRDHFRTSIDSLHRRVDIFVSEMISALLINKITSFNQCLKANIETDIASISCIKEIHKIIPSYLDYIWESFLSNYKSEMQNILLKELRELSEFIETDVSTNFEGMDNSIKEMISRFIDHKYQRRLFLMQQHDVNPLGKTTKWMNIGAAGLLLMGGAPYALMTFGSAQILRMVSKKRIQQGNMDSLIKTTLSSCEILMNNIIKQVSINFDQLTTEIKQVINATYQQIIEDTVTALEQHQHYSKEAGELLACLDEIDSSIPILKQN